MKIYLDNNLGVTNVEQEELTQDTYGYNILKVYIPNAVLTPYDTFTCYYGALLQNGRKVGWFAMEARTSTDADYEENYTLYKATLEQCVVSVEGKVYIGCQILLGNSGNATLIKKNTAVVQFNVRKSVAINNDILVLDPDQTNTDVLESYKNLLENALTTYVTKASIADNLTTNDSSKVLSAKQGKVLKDTIDALDDSKADKSNTYTKAEVNNITNDLSARITANADDIDTLEGNVTTLQDDVADLKSVQNVVDIVATYSALQSYDTSKLDIDDKVQVIADETHDGASTIYNWSGSTWQYVGAFGGNSYTKAETYNKTQIDSALSDKADKSNTYTRAVIDSMILTLSTDKADKSDTYTKTESDSTFAPKSTAITHTGNQLQDYGGNEIYPNLDDGQITEAKLSSALKLKVIKEYATPEMFGAVGDGVTNDTTAITSCMWYCYTNKVPCLCTKVYAVNKKIDISFDCYMSKDSKIIALEQPYNSQNEKQPLVLLGAYKTVGAEFKINVDANSVCDIAVDVSLCRKCKIDIWAYNFIDKGVYNGRTDSGNNENIFNIWAYGINGGNYKSNYGVYLTSGDSVYGDIVTVDCKTGVYTNVLLKANSLHCWLRDETYFNYSVCLDVVSGWTNNQIQIGYFYQDGVKTGIKMTSEASVCIDLFTYVPPYSFAYDENDVKHLLLKSASTVVINNTRIRLGSNYNDYGIFKFTKDSKYGVFALGRNNGENYSTTGRYKFADIDTLPDVGTFSVDNVTAPVNGTNVTIICTATGNAKQQIILYGGEIYIRFWQLGSSNSWGSWRKVENTIVS